MELIDIKIIKLVLIVSLNFVVINGDQVLDRRPYGSLDSRPYYTSRRQSEEQEPYYSPRVRHYPEVKRYSTNQDHGPKLVAQKGLEPADKYKQRPHSRLRHTIVVIGRRKPQPLYKDRPVAVDGKQLDQTIDDDSRSAVIEKLEREVNLPETGIPDCSLPPNPGTGSQQIPSVYFNPTTFTCEYFIYSGSGGNGNRFENIPQCHAVCDSSKNNESNDEKPVISGKIKKLVKGEGSVTGATQLSGVTKSPEVTTKSVPVSVTGTATESASEGTTRVVKAGKQYLDVTTQDTNQVTDEWEYFTEVVEYEE